jgi:hypothetical protein
MRVYHFVNKEYGLENIQKRRLKIATLNELNDPFELFGVEFSDPSVRSAFYAMKNELAQNRGLLCFSKSWHNPVQWSHYADKHKGLCLGFDVPDESLGDVNYSRKRLVTDIEKLKSPRQLAPTAAKKFLFTKYHHWKYENEIRSFVTLEEIDEEKQMYFADFSNKLSLKEVIVGSMSDITRKELANCLGDLRGQIKSFKARLAFKTFKVVKQRKEELWV